MLFSPFLSDPVMTRIEAALEPVDIPDDTHTVKHDRQKPASILMPLVRRDRDWQVLFTRRPMHMPSHAGQISFPGGRTETGESPLAGALRETREEVGISADHIHLLGRLPSFNAVSFFRVTPFVGIVLPEADIIPCPREVGEVFELPLSFLMDTENHVERKVETGGEVHTFYDMPWPDRKKATHNVWGMTAMMLYRLYQRAFEET